MTRAALLVVLAALRPAQEPPRMLYETEDGNAAEVYRSLVGRLTEVPESVRDHLRNGKNPDAAAASIEKLGPFLAKFEKAARARRCDWGPPMLSGIRLKSPHQQVAECAAPLPEARIRLQIRLEHPHEALSDLLVLQRVGSDSLSDGTLMTRLTGLAALARSYWLFQENFPRRTLRREDLRRVVAHTESILKRYPTCRKAMEDEKEAWVGALDRINVFQDARRVGRDCSSHLV